jgi:DNA-binding HxlR family transcriptional regulator
VPPVGLNSKPFGKVGEAIKDASAQRVCSITDALGLVGDRYALLVVREIRYGNTRFNDIAAATGAPRDVLTARLRKLELAGVVERRAYSERPPRDEYVLTSAGHELHPVLLALKEWGDRYCNPGAEPVVFEHTCGEEFHALTVCEACRRAVVAGELTVTGGTHPVDATL